MNGTCGSGEDPLNETEPMTSASMEANSQEESERDYQQKSSSDSGSDADSLSSASSTYFQVGDRVIVHSLFKAAHLNGRHGCIGGKMDPETGRYPIDFDTWVNRVMAKEVNLKREPLPDEYEEEKTDKDGTVDPMYVAHVQDGVLVEAEGRPLGLILDSIRFLVGSVLLQDPDFQRGLIDVEQLRQQGDIQKFRKLMATAWAHWNDAKPYYTPDNLNVHELLVQFFKELPESNPGHKMPTEFYTAMAALNHRTAVKGWNTRVEGEFWIVGDNEETGGTYLVAYANPHLVFEVFGIEKSLFSRLEEEHEPILINAVILPWYGRLVCDQAVKSAAKEAPDEDLIKQLEQSIDAAIEEGRVVEKLRQLELPEPEEEPQSSTSAPTPAESHYLNQIVDLPIAQPDEAIWCCRRRAYTEKDNPHHICVIINGVGGTAVGPFSCSALEPTALDILQALVAYCGEGDKLLPAVLLIDDFNCFERVQFLLQSLEIRVQYYPPPTAEETEAALSSR